MRPAVVDVVDEDAVHIVWEKLAVREQQLAGVHDGAPRLADATGLGEAPRRQAAEDVGEGIVGSAATSVVVSMLDGFVRESYAMTVLQLTRREMVVLAYYTIDVR